MSKRGIFGSKATNYDTPLAPANETRFQQWRGTLSPNLRGTDDYDLRGAYLANAQQAANGHLTDTYKKPNHITFSNESQYSTPQAPGGEWSNTGSGWSFWASPYNVQNTQPNTLLQYFKQYEPDSQLILPSFGWSLPQGRR